MNILDILQFSFIYLVAFNFAPYPREFHLCACGQHNGGRKPDRASCDWPPASSFDFYTWIEVPTWLELKLIWLHFQTTLISYMMDLDGILWLQVTRVPQDRPSLNYCSAQKGFHRSVRFRFCTLLDFRTSCTLLLALSFVVSLTRSVRRIFPTKSCTIWRITACACAFTWNKNVPDACDTCNKHDMTVFYCVPIKSIPLPFYYQLFLSRHSLTPPLLDADRLSTLHHV